MHESYVIVLLLLVILIYTNCDSIEKFIAQKKACSDIDGRCYKVSGKYKDFKKAGDRLAYMNQYCIRLLRYLRNKYVWNDSGNEVARDIVMFLLSNYNPDGIIENDPISDVNTSYVDDKGRVFALCLREKESGEHNFHYEDILSFVAIHEMAHMATREYGHEKEFWTNFKFLLKEAEKADLYTPVDYKKTPINYCSLRVNYNPYYDDTYADISS